MKEFQENFILKKRRGDSHKYDYGSILVVGGSSGMTGAPLMSAYSAMRTGSGLTTIAIRERYLHLLNNIYPEIMVQPYKSGRDFSELVRKKDGIAFGPGLGREDDAEPILTELLDMDIPLIIDADGIYHLKGRVHRIRYPQKVVITPHHGEMAMFLGIDSKVVSKDPISAIRQVTQELGIHVVLKGPTTYIAHPSEMVSSSLGNPGMATAGSGDVLAGIITSLAGQGISVFKACKLGVYIHSMAGNLAAEHYGEYSMMATDIIHGIPQVLKGLAGEKRKDSPPK